MWYIVQYVYQHLYVYVCMEIIIFLHVFVGNY